MLSCSDDEAHCLNKSDMSPNLLRVFGGVKIALASLSALVPMELFLLCILGYLIGSIPTGYLLMKYAAGKDIRELGSHSTGATNVLRSGNKTLALLTLLGDALKGIFFTLTLKLFCDDPFWLVAVFCCTIGHAYPIWLAFKGGKGVATSAGIFLVIAPAYAALSILVWAVLAKFLKISSVASLALSISFAALCTYGFIFGQTNLNVFLFSLASLVFLIFTHCENIRRIMHQDEQKVG
ncbi:MAG: glycerol-3-phosphate 1-O-acyltransferase PlsY [Alphaproteobacteria bacterium]|nr:glycerol-3-phosphate 1-O-acyltransferase PlsY [Alphaproteobacteria bacterium]